MTRWRIQLWCTGLCLAMAAFAQEVPIRPADLQAASVPLRTALYHDPTLAPPLDRLLQLYRDAGKVKELVETYRQHVSQYPADTGALVVLVRLLAATNDAEADSLARGAAQRFPENAFLQFLHFEQIQKAHKPGALDALDRAIEKETLPARKRAWIEQLLPLAIAEGRPEVAQRRLENLAADHSTAEGKLEVARKMISQKLYAPAVAVLEAATALKPAAETGVDLELAAVSAELGLQKEAAAAARLDRLLARLAPDYWRRTDILHRRTALVKTDADRESILATARARLKADPANESAALDLAQSLSAFEFRREALGVLQESTRLLPASAKIEKAALELFDLLRDERGREAFLAGRLRVAPDRQDLALAHARSLFLLGRRSEALAAFDALAARLEAPAHLTQLLELARFLRRASLHSDAAALFERAVALAPSRLDVRRELAETWLALGQKQKAREVFAANLPENAETENLLDLIQFFLKQDMLAEARSALAERVAKEPQNFDLRLTQLTVATRLADQPAGESLIASIRELADTDARYRRWLEGAVAFHEAFETTDAFLEEEQRRLFTGTGGWIGEGRERRLVFSEVAAASGRKAAVTDLIGEALSGELPLELRIELRRRQLALTESDPARANETGEQLKALIKDDPARDAEYRIRLALHAMRMQRTDQLAGILGNNHELIDLKKVNDAALLAGFENVLRQQGGRGRMLHDVLERLTVIEPANRGAWERWISALATGGDEEKLRTTLRLLLAGVDRLTLADETRQLLRSHLLASFWRSLNELKLDEDGKDARLGDALSMLDAAGRFAGLREEWLWITWTRAYVLNRLGQRAARDEAIAELSRVASTPATKPPPDGGAPESEAPAQDSIAFPDGLIIGLDQARELLTSPPRAASMPLPGLPQGPRGTLKARWAFDTDALSRVSRILPLDAGRLLILDTAARLYCLDTLSGKLRWSRAGPKPLTPPRDEYRVTTAFASNAVPAVNSGRIFLPDAGGIECWSGDDGRLLWRATDLGEVASVYPSLFFHAGRLLVCNPTQATIQSLDPATGKIDWQREYPRQKVSFPLHALNCGASYSDGRILLYGAATIIASAANGTVQWSFGTSDVKGFPLSLADISAQAPVPAPYQLGQVPRFQRGGMQPLVTYDYRTRRQSSSHGWIPQPGQPFVLANAAASWAFGGNDGGQSRFAILSGQKLLLFSSQSLHTVRLDLPFLGSQVYGRGAVAGFAGRFACLVEGRNIQVIDLDSGTAQQIVLSASNRIDGEDNGDGDAEIARQMQNSVTKVQAAIDGPLIYVSEKSGISGYLVRTSRRVFHSPWPKSVAPAETPADPAGSMGYVQHGRMFYNGQYGTIEPNTAVVIEGVFYSEADPGRVVALVGEARKEEQ
jgi:hypothetical protein